MLKILFVNLLHTFLNISYAKESLNIAVASNFLLPMEKIAKLYGNR